MNQKDRNPRHLWICCKAIRRFQTRLSKGRRGLRSFYCAVSATERQDSMSRQKIKGGTAIFICTVPPTFKPQRCWDVPDEILTAYLHAKNLAMSVALGFARVHNIAQVRAFEHGSPIVSWAIVIRHLKPEWKNHPLRENQVANLPLETKQEEGGVPSKVDKDANLHLATQDESQGHKIANAQEGGAA